MALYAFDGTWQDADQQDQPQWTNVKRFVDLYRENQGYYYQSGPGTRFGKVGKGLGGVFGVGTNQRVSDAYKNLKLAYANGDRTVDIVGFSRGAASALVFAWRLNQGRTKSALGVNPEIRFVGLFDTVFYVMGMNDMPLKEQIKVNMRANKFTHSLLRLKETSTDLKLPPLVKQAVHALSLDDQRAAFRPARIADAKEVWFTGRHSDIGGGSDQPHLSDISLKWMIDQARASGVPVNPLDNAEPSTETPFEQQQTWSSVPREVRAGDTVHASVLRLGGETLSKLPEHAVEPE